MPTRTGRRGRGQGHVLFERFTAERHRCAILPDVGRVVTSTGGGPRLREFKGAERPTAHLPDCSQPCGRHPRESTPRRPRVGGSGGHGALRRLGARDEPIGEEPHDAEPPGSRRGEHVPRRARPRRFRQLGSSTGRRDTRRTAAERSLTPRPTERCSGRTTALLPGAQRLVLGPSARISSGAPRA